MITRSILAVIAAFLILFFGGWVIYGMLLMDFLQAHTIQYEGLMNIPPKMVSLVISDLLFALMLVVVLYWANVRSLAKGLATGAILFFLMAAAYDASFRAFMNLHDATLYAVDILVFTALGALMGAVAAGIMGRGDAS